MFRSLRFAIKFLGLSSLSRSLRLMFFVTSIGIFLAVFTLAIALSLTNGFHDHYEQTLQSFNAHVSILSHHEEESETLHQALEAVKSKTHSPHIISEEPFLYREAMLFTNRKIKGVILKGMTLSEETKKKIHVHFFSDAGKNEIQNKEALPELILGSGMAVYLGITQHSPASLMLPQKSGKQKYVQVNIVGVFSSGMYEFDQDFSLIRLDSLRSLFALSEHTITGVELNLDHPKLTQKIIDRLDAELGYDYDAIPWNELNKDLFAALQLEKRVISFIVGLLLLVSSINLMVMLYLLIRFRHHDLAVLSSLGMSKRKIRDLVFTLGISIGGGAAFCGVLAAAVMVFLQEHFELVHLDAEVYSLPRLPLDFSWMMWGIIVLFSVLLAIVSSLFALRFQTSQRVVESLARGKI